MGVPSMKFLQPPTWAPARGYANGVVAEGKPVFLAGQVGWDPETQQFTRTDFVGQFEQALKNITAILAEVAARPEHVVRMTWFVVDRELYLKSIGDLGAIYRGVMGRHYPAMSVIAVSGLVDKEALLEIEATAVVP